MTGTNCCPPLTPYFVMKVGHVPVIPYHRPGDPLAADRVAQTITRYGQQGTPIRAVMLGAPGPQRLARHARRRHGHAGRTGRNRAAVAAEPRRRPRRCEPIDDLRQI